MTVPEVIDCRKSLSSRLGEYQDLLSNDDKCSEINEIWSSLFECLVVIKVGWQGLWVVSRKNCKQYNLLYPTVVIVKVHEFNAESLTATVTVEAVQDDIILPSILDVDIKELHPIKNQDFDKKDLTIIADWFDKVRYFFNYLWYPWDADDLDTKMSNWCVAHLSNRLQLQYDAKSGVLGDFAMHYLKSLLEEAKEIHEHLTNIPTDTNKQKRNIKLAHYYLRRKEIMAELELFELGEFRHSMIELKKYGRENLLDPLKKSNKGKVRFAWMCLEGTAYSFLKHVEIVKNLISEDITIKTSDSLQTMLNTYRQDDIILVSQGEHFIQSIGNLRHGGSMKGIYPSGALIKTDPNKPNHAVLFDSCGFLTLENLTIMREEGTCIQVSQNRLKISNCKISAGNPVLSKGIIVSSNCSLEVNNCEFKNFATAVFLEKGARAEISNTVIHDCVEGIRVGDESKLSLENVEISSCTGYGLRVESSKVESTIPIKGDINILQNIDDVKLESVVLLTNKNDVTLNQNWLIDSEDELNDSCNSDGFEDSITEIDSGDVDLV